MSVSNGKVQHWNPQGTTLLDTLDSLKTDTFQGSSTTGMAFDSIGNLYLTTFVGGDVTKFDNKGVLIGTFGTGYSGFPESILFDRSGNAYVGAVDSPDFKNPVRKFDPAGNPLGSFPVQPEVRGSDWIDLAGDQCTLFYTSEGIYVHRFNLCNQQPLANFNLIALPGRAAYALRILPSGGALVADTSVIVRLDAAGNPIQSYDAPGEDCWFALNLDPDGKSFWSADFCSSQVHKFDIESGSELLRFSTGTAPGTVFGLVIFGEITTGRPSGLTASVGDSFVHVTWRPAAETVDGYNLYAQLIGSSSVTDLGKVNTSGLISVPVFGVVQFADGSKIQNDQLYRFSLTAVKNGIESPPSDFVFARPGKFAVARPIFPILLLHGWDSDENTWSTTRDYFANTLLWQFGGTVGYEPDPNDSTKCPIFNAQSLIIGADFYTVHFGNNLANYPGTCKDNGILQQANEVQGFVTELHKRGLTKKLRFVAHSMGGLAGRAYIANPANLNEVSTSVSDLITYGTPHWGTFAAFFAPLLVGRSSQGADDMLVSCSSDGHLDYSQNPFLDNLRVQTLPAAIRYFTIRGNPILTPPLAGSVCLSVFNDLVVPIDSADFNGRRLSFTSGQLFDPFEQPPQNPITTTPTPLLTTSKYHLQQQTSDFSNILCALAPKCLIVQVQSPVDFQVLAPTGKSIAPQLAEIPAASYMSLQDDLGALHATAIIPYPRTGQYSAMVFPKPGAAATDTFSLTATVGDSTVTLADNMPISQIPANGFQFMVDGNSAPIADAGPNEMMPAGSPTGTPVTLDGSGSVDPDGDPITYRWMGPFPEGNGTVTGAHPVVTLQAGNNQIALVVSDGQVDSTPASVAVTLTDFDVSASSTSATVSAGQSGTYDLTINPKFGAFGNAISLACSNLPPLAGCSFSPSSLTPGAAPATSKLTITTTAASVASSSLSLLQPFDVRHGRLALGLLSPLLFLVVLLKRRKLSTRKVGLAYGLAIPLGFLLLMQSGCNSGNAQPPSKPGTPPGAYSITVTGSSGSLQHQISVTLTVH